MQLLANRTSLRVSVRSGARLALSTCPVLPLLPLCLLSIKQMPLVARPDLEPCRARDSGKHYQLSQVDTKQSHNRGELQRQVIRKTKGFRIRGRGVAREFLFNASE